MRPTKSPYGAPLLFLKKMDKDLSGVVEYRAMNLITKKKMKPFPCSDEMFDRLGDASVVSELYLKTGSDRIRVKPEDFEKMVFNKKSASF